MNCFGLLGINCFTSLMSLFTHLYNGVSLLGSPLWDAERFTIKALNVLIDKVKDLQTLILEIDDPQVELHLLQSCLNVCKINHLLRTIPSEIILNQLGKLDENIRSTLAGIIHSPMPCLKLFFQSVTEA